MQTLKLQAYFYAIAYTSFMKHALWLFLALFWVIPIYAQPSSTTARHIITGATLPATCSPNTGDIYDRVTAGVASPFYCSAVNTWSAWTGGGGGGSPAGSTGDWQTNAGGGSFGAFTPGTGVQSFAITPTSSNLATAVTDETGSGSLVFANTPTLITPVLGIATGTSLSLSGSLTSGSGGGSTGTLNISGATSGTIGITCSAVCGTWTFKLPATAGSANNVLSTDGAGNLSWVSNSSSISIGSAIGSGTSGSALYVDGSGNLAQANANYQFDSTNFNLLVGTASHAVRIGTISGLSTFPGIWFGDAGSPSSTNYSFLFDSSNGTILNTPSGKLLISRVANSDVLHIGAIAGQGAGSISSAASYFWMNNVGTESTTNVRLYGDANTTILNAPSTKTVALDVNAVTVFSCTSSLCTSAQPLKQPTFNATTNCSNAASPAVCGAAPTGAVAIPTGVTSVSLTVNTTAVTANSEIFLVADDSLTIAATTCNSTLATLVGGMAITARAPGTSFTITYNGTIATNPLCVAYAIIN